ncbi:MAG: glutamine synthetase adenylyltransferase [Chloroflexi bacterium]|nr:MAG: glutamine synthetase adenylyltransferase [Chloroflexota bacterium]
MKERIEAKLRRRNALWGEVKLGEGSIRDIEFVTQYLQLAHGACQPDLRQRSTLAALSRLAAAGLLSPDEYRILADGYIFLRTVEHHLQLLHYRQTHALPDDPATLNHLARRLRFQGADAGRRLVDRYDQHSRAIRAVYRRYLEANDGDLTMTVHNNTPRPVPAPFKRHVDRMPATYTITFSEPDIARHFELIERLDARHPVEIDAEPLDADAADGTGQHWRVTIVGFDHVGQLSLICGLLFAYGFDIVEGHVFSYGREQPELKLLPETARTRRRTRRKTTTQTDWRKIVDVFTVRSLHGKTSPRRWADYAADLTALTERLLRGEQREAQGELAKRVAREMPAFADELATLYPIDIHIDNDLSDRHTVLRIDARDTPGFLYELTNALALIGINIRRMTVETEGNQVRDTLYVIDTRNEKITDPDQQRKLRAATALIKEFTHLLPRSPNPEAALLNFRQFIGHLFARPNWPDELTSLERPDVLQTLARLLGVSEFLWTDFLRMQYANLFPLVSNTGALAERKDKASLQAELSEALHSAAGPEERRRVLNDFKDREMFRIDMRQIQGLITEYGQFSAELTDLAEVVVEAAYQMCLDELQAGYGLPRQPDGTLCPMTVCGLGKCGGRELGFASDIELMFIYDGEGRTTGPRQIGVAEFYEKVVQAVNAAIRSKREGIFELDLRLRPYGKAGRMAVSLESFRRYFAPTGDAWPYERQALIKLRPIAGDMRLGREIVRLRDELIYTGAPFDTAAMRAMRERQLRHLVTPGVINAKFSPGGLVDVEYLVQALQITHGGQNPNLRQTNTRQAMDALAAAGILSPEEHRQLAEAHMFLRRLINALRMVRGHARDLNVPPPDSEEFEFLARRLNYGSDIAQLHNDLLDHTTTVQELSTKLLEKHAPQ